MQQKHKIILSVLAVILLGYYFYPSEYDNLMSPIKKIKAKEKKEDRPNPTYDGVVEPDFPNEKLNNSTIEGVDSNKDGVRDDIEIWINRNAEDKYVRLSLKHLYRAKLAANLSIYNNKPELDVREKESFYLKAGRCLSITLRSYKEFYRKREIFDKNIIYNNQLDDLFYNSSKRQKLHAKKVRFEFEGPVGNIDLDDFSYCDHNISSDTLKEMIRKN